MHPGLFYKKRHVMPAKHLDFLKIHFARRQGGDNEDRLHCLTSFEQFLHIGGRQIINAAPDNQIFSLNMCTA